MAETPYEAQWVVDNIYTIARRELGPQLVGRTDRLMWGHVLRLCEKAGAATRTVGVLRSESQPTPGAGTGGRRGRLAQQAMLVERLRDLALAGLPDSGVAGPAGNGYAYAWDECTNDEQEWVQAQRTRIHHAADALLAVLQP